MSHVNPKDLYEWCRIPAENIEGHPKLRASFRMVKDSAEMGELMAREFVETIEANNAEGRPTRAISDTPMARSSQKTPVAKCTS